MIEGSVVDTVRLKDGFAALSDSGYTFFKPEHKLLAYKSQTLDSFNLYSSFKDNIIGAKNVFLKQMPRQEKMVCNNSFYHYCKRGIFADVYYWDFKRYYPTIFEQICDHIDEGYFGKPITSTARRDIFFRHEIQNNVKFTKEAMKKELVDAEDLAANAIKIGVNDKSGMRKLITGISDSKFSDEADARVAKITRNALCYGFGYQNKNARINNICALVMFFAKELLRHVSEELMSIGGHKTIFNHTDSMMLHHLDVKDFDNAIRGACALVNQEYFYGNDIIALGFNNIGLKGKFEDLIVFSQNAYISSTIAPAGRRDVNLKISGLNTLSECSWGIDRQGNSIQEILSDNLDSIFSFDKQIPDADREFLYSILHYRIDEAYEQSTIDKWRNGRNVYNKACIVSQTLRHINYLKRVNVQ